jgi:hypothetical protein
MFDRHFEHLADEHCKGGDECPVCGFGPHKDADENGICPECRPRCPKCDRDTKAGYVDHSDPDYIYYCIDDECETEVKAEIL